MDIREIRIDQFGCWQDVVVHSLPLGLNAIHLDDGGQPFEFSRFIHSVLFGFDGDHKSAAGGAIVFDDGERVISLDRQITSRGTTALRAKLNGRLADDGRLLEEQAQAAVTSILADRFFVPAKRYDGKSNWMWLASQSGIIRKLLGESNAVANPRFAQKTAGQWARDAANMRQWEFERDELKRQIDERSVRLRSQTNVVKQQPVPQLTAAEIEDELRMLRHQQTPLEQALSLAEKWRARNELKLPADVEVDVDALNKAFANYKKYEKEKRQHQQILTRRPAQPVHRPSPTPTDRESRDRNEFAVRRLLDQREWVLEASDVPLEASREQSFDASMDVRHAANLVQTAQQDSVRAESELREFVSKTGFDWSELEEAPAVERREIACDSPFADAPLSDQLAELKRRRVWVEQEFQCLLGRQSLSSQVRLWIVILFVLSIATLFGTLVVLSHLGQLVLVAVGLCGVAASGAIKLALEKRAAHNLARTHDRLHQIDREIASIAEELWDEEEARSLADAREQKRLRMGQLQQAVVEANRRLDSAELAFRELLIAKRMSPTLSPDEALSPSRINVVRQTSTTTSTPRKLTRWIKAAQEQIRRNDGECRSEDPEELLAALERIFTQLRHRDHSQVRVKKTRKSSSQDLHVARKELQRLDKLQRSILRRAKMHDVYELESAIEKVVRRTERRRKWEKLDREISIQLDTHEDGSEIRELLETLEAAELQRRITELGYHKSELESMLRQHEHGHASSTANAEASDLQRELDELRVSLAETEAKICCAAEAAQQVPHDSEPVATPSQSFLRELTGGRFDSLRFSAGQFLLANDAAQDLQVLDYDSAEADLVWLALKLQLATMLRRSSMGQTLPLVLLADELFASPHANNIYQVLSDANRDGLQILLLTGNQRTVNQLVDAGASAVRIGLCEERSRFKEVEWQPALSKRAA